VPAESVLLVVSWCYDVTARIVGPFDNGLTFQIGTDNALLSPVKDCRHNAGAAASVENGEDQKRAFVRRVNNQKIPDRMKAQYGPPQGPDREQ
jgi:hypothetical protein